MAELKTASLIAIEKSPFFILQLSHKFTFGPKCFNWSKRDPKLYQPDQMSGSADIFEKKRKKQIRLKTTVKIPNLSQK
jgi:hypothetical protein